MSGSLSCHAWQVRHRTSQMDGISVHLVYALIHVIHA